MSKRKPVVQFQVEEKVKKQIEKLAKDGHCTFASQCRLALESWLKTQGILFILLVMSFFIVSCSNPVKPVSVQYGYCNLGNVSWSYGVCDTFDIAGLLDTVTKCECETWCQEYIKNNYTQNDPRIKNLICDWKPTLSLF